MSWLLLFIHMVFCFVVAWRLVDRGKPSDFIFTAIGVFVVTGWLFNIALPVILKSSPKPASQEVVVDFSPPASQSKVNSNQKDLVCVNGRQHKYIFKWHRGTVLHKSDVDALGPYWREESGRGEAVCLESACGHKIKFKNREEYLDAFIDYQNKLNGELMPGEFEAK
jgi:hypothetical protein